MNESIRKSVILVSVALIPAVQATLPPQDTVVRSYEERFAKAP